MEMLQPDSKTEPLRIISGAEGATEVSFGVCFCFVFLSPSLQLTLLFVLVTKVSHKL